MATDDGFVIANEFAHVRVRMVPTPEGDTIEISAPTRSRVVHLDAKVLWILAAQPSETFTQLLADAPIGFKES